MVTAGRPVTLRTVLHEEKTVKNSRIVNHFAKVCRMTKVPIKPKPRVKNFDDTFSEAATIGTSATIGEQVNQIETMMQRQSIYDANYDSDYDDFDVSCVAVISDSDNIREVEPVNMHIRFGNTEAIALWDLGSVCAIINKSLANAVVLNSQESYWVQSSENLDLKSFSNELIKNISVINTSVKCNDWAAEKFNVTVVEVGNRPIIGRDFFPQLGRSLTQTEQVSNVDQNQWFIKKQMTHDFHALISRIGKSLKHTVKSTFHKHFTPSKRTTIPYKSSTVSKY